ncbi:MAG TPA: OmpA family protein [Spirochaetota bacterium]|nr:OmpA family protein [Spirochaetota bacterium]HRZ25987.1 OmpA family protein [Spirochaetota bacterium]HSA14004.1 OmpA family protein [Spirochaetota bacterium]
MKKILLLAISALVFTVAGAVAYLLLSDTMLMQPPVLIKQNPVITYVIGDVKCKTAGDAAWCDAVVGMKLTDDSEVRSGEKSLADIRFHGGTAIRVSENSSMRIKDISINELKIQVQEGAVFGKFERIHKTHTIELHTDTTVAAIRGTELGIVVGPAVTDADKEEAVSKKSGEPADQEKPSDEKATTVYALSGIIGVYNSNFYEDTVLLSNQKKLVVLEDSPPSNPEKMGEDEIERIQAILNSIHEDEVLFISDKIHFKTGSASILPESYPELDKISGILSQRSEKVRIEGHTDSEGKAYSNHILSISRAESIKEYLAAKGVKAERLSIVGYGESKPIADNDSEEGKAQNRRVEFIIVQ